MQVANIGQVVNLQPVACNVHGAISAMCSQLVLVAPASFLSSEVCEIMERSGEM